MTDNSFFEEQKEQSLVKSTIVSKYFDAWAKVIIGFQKRNHQSGEKIAYIDLFAGPGRYKDGSDSTPLQILTNAIREKDLCERLVTIFNDKDQKNSNDLRDIINGIPGIDSLKYKPDVWNLEVGEEIVKKFEKIKLVPTLFFVDPWGYKGLSIRLVNSVIKDWGCDAIFFFNYNRINMGINNEAVQDHMQALFGEARASLLKNKIIDKDADKRELLIIEELCEELKSYGSRYILPFRFKNDKGKRTSHHIIFVSKSFRGYEIMKDIMARESTKKMQGVHSFEYNPSDFLPQQSLLFQLNRPLDDLKGDLLNKFKGKSLKMNEIYKQHNVDTPYVKKNYKDVLRNLYDNGSIEVEGKPPKKDTFGDNIMVKFPK